LNKFGVTENHCLSSGSHRDGVSVPSGGPGFQNGASGALASISWRMTTRVKQGRENSVY